MNLGIRLEGEAASADELRTLRAWLLAEEELRGCVQMINRPPAPGRLGPVLDALRIVAEPTAAVLTASLIAWIRSRVGAVRLVLTSRRGIKLELDARKVRGLDADGLADLTKRVTRLIDGELGPSELGEESGGPEEVPGSHVRAGADSPDD